MDQPIELSIIIVNYNTKKLIKDCIASIIKSLSDSNLSYEIIVVDNGSKDGSQDMISENFPQVKLIANVENAGFGKANNQGINLAKGAYILLLNSDIIVLTGSILKLFGFAKRHAKSFAGAKLFNVDGSKQSSCGPFFSLPVVFASLFLKGDVIGLTRKSPDRDCLVDWVSGACLIGAKTLFEKTGGFDESIFMYMDEIDLLYRARQIGIRTWFYPNASFVHIGAASSKGRSKPVINIYKGLAFFYKKHQSQLQYKMLCLLLTIKSTIAVLIGIVFFNDYLKKTYAEALKTIKK